MNFKDLKVYILNKILIQKKETHIKIKNLIKKENLNKKVKVKKSFRGIVLI